jgi:Fe-S oxidoreductase
MVHHTQLLNQLLREKKLLPIKMSHTAMTYHDPCYLGRHNEIYQPPREILEATGVEITEMPRNKERSFCWVPVVDACGWKKKLEHALT